jgi:hypothetical protein
MICPPPKQPMTRRTCATETPVALTIECLRESESAKIIWGDPLFPPYPDHPLSSQPRPYDSDHIYSSYRSGVLGYRCIYKISCFIRGHSQHDFNIYINHAHVNADQTWWFISIIFTVVISRRIGSFVFQRCRQSARS